MPVDIPEVGSDNWGRGFRLPSVEGPRAGAVPQRCPCVTPWSAVRRRGGCAVAGVGTGGGEAARATSEG